MEKLKEEAKCEVFTIDNRRLESINSFIVAQKARVMLFESIVNEEPLDNVKNYYIANSPFINHKLLHPAEREKLRNGYKLNFSNRDKAEALRRFNADREVAVRFYNAGLIEGLLVIEQEFLDEMIQTKDYPQVRDRFKEIGEELRRREATSE